MGVGETLGLALGYVGLGEAEPENSGENAERITIHAKKRDFDALPPPMPALKPARPVSLPGATLNPPLLKFQFAFNYWLNCAQKFFRAIAS